MTCRYFFRFFTHTQHEAGFGTDLTGASFLHSLQYIERTAIVGTGTHMIEPWNRLHIMGNDIRL